MQFFFDNWDSLFRIALSAPLLYVVVILYIQIMGKRSTSKMNNFDWVVTVALGSMLASGILLQEVPILNVLVGIFLLLLLQYLLNKMAAHFDLFKDVVRADPTLLYFEGCYLEDNMKDERVLKEEIVSAAREAGFVNMQQVCAVVLESNAELSILPAREEGQACDTLVEVAGIPEEMKKKIEQVEDAT